MTMHRRKFCSKAPLWIALSQSALACVAAKSRYKLTSADMETFRLELRGKALFVGDPAYETHRLALNRRYDGVFPFVIAVCLDAADIKRALAWAKQRGVPVAARCGGHSYTGQSLCSGMVIDLSAMKRVDVDPAAGTATVEAGCTAIEVSYALWQHRLAIPTGSCPTVGIAGLALGGGYGYTSRSLGLTCDSILEAEVVTAAGEVITCNEQSHADLFWALRGGGGGHFGIVTRFQFKAHAVDQVATFRLDWDWEHAAQVVAAWQDWAPFANAGLVSTCALGKGGERPTVACVGQYMGTEKQLRAQLDAFLDSCKSPPRSVKAQESSHWDAVLHWAGCGPTVESCRRKDRDPHGVVQRAAFAAKSDYFKSKLSDAGLAALIAGVEARQRPDFDWGGIQLDAFGGAIGAVARTATAFVHRDALFMAQYLAYWQQGDGPEMIERNRDWLGQVRRSLTPFSADEAYQNYLDDSWDSFAEPYFKENRSKLLAIKDAYDRENMFRGYEHADVLANKPP